MAWLYPTSGSNGIVIVANSVFVGPNVQISAPENELGCLVTLNGVQNQRAIIYGTLVSAGSSCIWFDQLDFPASYKIEIRAGALIEKLNATGQAMFLSALSGPKAVINAGTVRSERDGIVLSGNDAVSVDTVTNSGSIQAAVWGVAQFSAHKTKVTNTGLLQGGDRSITLHNLADIVINSGRLVGDVLLWAGNDVYNGAAGRLSGKLFASDGADTATGGAFADWFEGGIGADTLTGNGGTDTLIGDAGADKLNGGAGRDILTGGADADRFIFSAKTHSVTGVNADRILDFDDGNTGDRIDLSALFGPAMSYRHSGAFSAAGQVRINNVSGADVVVEVNTGGTLAADFSIRLVGTTLASMSSGDFVL